MVDLFALVVSLGMLAMVVFFAMRLDKQLPWFERPSKRAGAPQGTGPQGKGLKDKAASPLPGRAAAGRNARPSRFPTGR